MTKRQWLRHYLLLLFAPSFCYATNGSNSLNEFLSMSLEELSQVPVTSASRYEQRIYNAPAIINVLTKQDIRRYGAKTLVEALHYFPGYIALSDLTAGERGTALRGDTNISGNRVLVLIDNKPLRAQSTYVYTLRVLLQAFPIESIERIELVRGAGSATYGTNAVTAVINIVTNRPKQNDTEFQVEAGNLDTQTISLNSSFNKNEFSIRTTIKQFTTDGWSSDFSTLFTPLGERIPYSTPKEISTLLSSLDYRNLSMTALVSNYDSGFVRPLEGRTNDQNLAQYRYFNLDYSLQISPEWNSTLLWSFANILDSQYHTEEENHRIEILLNGNLNQQGCQLIAGVSTNISDVSAADPNVIGYNGTTNTYSAFAQIERPLLESLTGHFGLQFNKVENGDDDLSPRIGFIYEYSDRKGIKLLYNKAFRSPTTAEYDFKLYNPALDSIVFENNPDLKSETVKTVDLQWFHYQDNRHITLTAFHSIYEDRIENDFNIVPARFTQIGKLTIIGLEAESKWKINEHNIIDWGWTWQRNEDNNDNSDVTLAPRWILNTGYTHEFKNAMQLSLFNQHVDSFKNSGNPATNPNPGSYNLLSVNINIPLQQQAIKNDSLNSTYITLKANNLLDEDIWQPELILPYYNSIQVYGGRTVSLSFLMQF